MNRNTKLVLAGVALAVLAGRALAQHGGMGPVQPPQPVAIQVPESGVRLPMKDFGGRPVVDVTIDGKGPYPFIFDTGATMSVLDAKLGEELALPEPDGMNAVPAHGGATARLVSIRELRVGGASVQGVTAAVMPLASLLGAGAPRGVLSANQFPAQLVTFDYPGKTISIARGALDAPDDRAIFEYDGPLPTVTVHVAGYDARALLDTGSPRGLVLPKGSQKDVPLASPPVDAGKARMMGAEYPLTKARVKGPIVLGGRTLGLSEVGFCDGPPGPMAAGPNLGSAALRDLVVTIDSRHKRVRIGS